MKLMSREFKLVSPPIDNTFNRFKGPKPSVTLKVEDKSGTGWIIDIQEQSARVMSMALKVDQHIELFGSFSDTEIITNKGRFKRRSGICSKVKGLDRFTKTRNDLSIGKRISKMCMRYNETLNHGWVGA